MATTAAEAIADLPGGLSRARYLRIFIRDHLAMATLAVELGRRVERTQTESGLAAVAARLVPELEKDRAALREIASRFGVRPSALKEGGAWLAEKFGRLKLNGRLLRRSPLSAIAELEALAMLTSQRRIVWRIFERMARVDGRLDGVDVAGRLTAVDDARGLVERAIGSAAVQAL